MSSFGECSGSAHLPTRGGAAALVPWQSVPRRDPQVVNGHNKTLTKLVQYIYLLMTLFAFLDETVYTAELR